MKVLNHWFKRMVHGWLFTYEYEIQLMSMGKIPIKAYKNDAGYDLFISRSVTIPPKQFVNVATGIAIKNKSHCAWIMLTGRSSALHKHGIMVDVGIIDGDYTGELFIKAYNTSKEVIHLYPNMRIGQIIVMPHTSIKWNLVNKLEVKSCERGNRGFGSSGR